MNEEPPRTGPALTPGGHPTFGEELRQHQAQPDAYGFDPSDGLPRPFSLTDLAAAESPPLSIEGLVCMADLSQFVIRDRRGEVLARYEPDEVTRLPNGRYVLKRPTSEDRKHGRRPLLRIVDEARDAIGLDPSDVEVEPVRPKCAHYARTKVDFPGDRDHRYYSRVCTKQRSENGEYLSLEGSRVWACELRSPRNYETETQLDDFDHEQIAAAAVVTETFDVDSELADDDRGAGGIFK